MRKLGIALAVVLVLVVIAIAALPYLLDVNSYRGKIQSELQARTGRPVSLGQMELKVFPFAFRVQNAVIGEDPRFRSTAPFAQAQELLVSVKLMPLLSKRVEVNSIELMKPKIELIRNEQGVWNFSSIGKPAASAQQPPPGQKPAPQPQGQPQPTQPPPQQQAQGQQFELGRLVISDGQVGYTDLQKRQPRAVYDHIDLDLRDYAPGKPVNIDLAARLPGGGKQELRLNGKGGPMQDNVIATNFDGTLKLDGVSLSGLKKFVNSQAVADMDFTATGNTDISNKNGVITAKGNVTLQNPRVKKVNIGYPIAADFDVIDDMNRDVLTINKGALKLGSTPVDIKGSLNTGATPSQLDLRALVKNASIADAAKLAGAFGVAFNPGMQVAGTVDADMTVRGTSSSPIMNGTLGARELVISGKQLAQPVHVTQVNLQLTPNQVRSNEFVASTGSTSVHVAFAMNDYSTPKSTIDATVKAPNSQLGELIAIGQAYGVDALDGMAGSGPVSIDLRVNGPTKNPAAINYAGSGSLQNASLTVPSFTKPIQIRNANIRFSQNAMTLDNAAFSLGSTHAAGQMTVRGLTPNATPQTQFTLNADTFNVAEWKGMMRNQPVKTATTWSLVPIAYAQAKAEPTLMERLVGNGVVTVGTVINDQLQLTNVKSNVTLDHGLIKMSPINANLYGGNLGGTVVVDTRPTPVTYTVQTKLTGVDANKLLSSVSNLKQTLFGILAANANTKFTGTTNGASSDVAKTLNGTLDLNLQNGRLAGIDMLNQLASIGKFLNLTKASEPFTNIAKLTGNFDVRNGVAHTENLTAVIDGGTLGAKGDVDLANQSINMAATAVLSQQMAQQVGGTGIGGYLSTALANSKGELVMPVLITGKLTSPQVAPDTKTIAQMKINNVLPTLTNPSSFSNILGALTGKQQQQQPANANQQPGQAQPNQQQSQQQQQQQQKQNAVQGILDALAGKKPAQQQQPAQQPPAQQQPPADEDKLPDPSKPKI
jgi:AsmA protein